MKQIPVLFALVLILLCCTTLTPCQEADVEWLRVLTNEDSFIDVDRDSLVMDVERVFTARFRTTYFLDASPKPKALKTSRVQFDIIQFDADSRNYRILGSGDGEAIAVAMSNRSSKSLEWRSIPGRFGRKMLSSARQLPPFGAWKIVSYRFATGEGPSQDDPPGLKSLIGTNFTLRWDEISIGEQTCKTPAFETRTVTSDDYLKLTGSSFASIGIPRSEVRAVLIKCPVSENTVQYFVLRLPDERAVMLWDGVFLELHRIKTPFNP